MITRRDFVTALSSIPFAKFLGIRPAIPKAASTVTPTQDSEDFTKFVKIAIGTGGHGHTYPGATVPFGMVQLSPDTYNDGGGGGVRGYTHSPPPLMIFFF